MASPQQVPTSAEITLPSTAWGGAPEGLLTAADLRIRNRPRPNTYIITTAENYSRASPNIFTVHDIAGPGLTRPQFDLIPSLIEKGIDIPLGVSGTAEIQHLRERLDTCGDVVDVLNYQQLRTIVTPSNELQGIAESVFADLCNTPLKEHPGRKAFPNAGVHLVTAATKLRYRIKMVSFLMRFQYDSVLAAGDLTSIQAASESGGLAFQSSEGLLDGTILLDAYLGPLLGCMTPAFWGFPAVRSFGSFIFSLGGPLAGTRPRFAAESLQTLLTQNPATTTTFPVVPARGCVEAIGWWTVRLDRLFGVLTDPAVFTARDHSGKYSAVKHIHGLLSIEQLFRRVHSLQVAHRDVNARRVLLFSIFDTIEGLTGTDIEQLCRLSYVTKVVEELRAAMSPGAASVLLWPAERALEALKEVQDGFFLHHQNGQNMFEYADRNSQTVRMAFEDAAASYIKLLRNATHGHGDDVSKRAPRTNALLAAHNGRVSHDLPLLGYVYLLRILSDEQLVRRNLHFRSRI